VYSIRYISKEKAFKCSTCDTVMSDIQEIGELLYRRRKTLGLSQQQVASANGMSRVTLSRFENGKLPEIGIRKVMAICATLGLELTVKDASPRPTLQELINEREN
jgi:HTH-type transcriptional regulator / antitoxin HipB